MQVSRIEMDAQTGKYIFITGICIAAAGAVIYFLHDHFTWFGKLPGDIRLQRGNVHFYFPFTTLLLISAVATLLLYLFKKIF